jgi:hypothetical protein
VRVYTQFIFNDATDAHVDGAYVMWTPSPARDLHVLAGKIPWLIGTWAPRTYSDRNPLVGLPLMYQHHTTLLWYDFPMNADALLSAAGSGQYGVDYGYGAYSRGMAIIDDSYWDFGAMVSGSQRPFEGAVGFVNGTPGWPSTLADENDAKTLLGRVGVLPHPSLRVGVSGAYGPYLGGWLDPYLPAGKTALDYHQKLRMADLEFLFGHVELRSEGFVNTWETPTVGALDVWGGYVEGKVTLGAGLHVAARVDRMRFSELADSGGRSRPWDHDRERTEFGVGYRLTRDVIAKAVAQRNQMRRDAQDGGDQRSDLVGAQLSVRF